MADDVDLQQVKREIRRRFKNPALRRILFEELESGRGTEVYRLDDDGTGKPMFFNITAMKKWAKENLEISGVPPDYDRAEQLITSGAVDRDYIFETTIRTKPAPILICQDVLGGDQIVDGAHRFMAFCAGCAMFNIKGQFFPSYVLSKSQWRKFVVPPLIAEMAGFAKADL